MGSHQNEAAAIEQRCVARFDGRHRYTDAHATSRIPGMGAALYKLINHGAERNAAPKLPEEHRFGMTIVEVEPGHTSGLYQRSTEEVLFVLEGEVTMTWGDRTDREPAVVGRWGTLTTQPGAYRQWTNSGSGRLMMLMVFAGRDEVTRDGIAYHPSVLAGAELHSLALSQDSDGWVGEFAHYDDLPKSEETFISGGVPGYRKTIHKAIGAGLAVLKGFGPAIKVPHPFSISIIEIPAGEGAGLHSHTNEELFFPLDGSFEVFWHDGDGPRQTLRINRWDLFSVPTGLWRGFINDSDRTVHVLVLSGGRNEELKNAIAYHPEVLKQIAEAKGITVEKLLQPQ